MERYDYLTAITNDVVDYINEHGDELHGVENLEEELNERLLNCDQVTGNASGSYTFNTWTAEEYICHNLELLGEACNEFGTNTGELLTQGAEACDVTIRCYLLPQAISAALDQIEL